MSNLLSKEQANLIVSKLMADIPYNINIMNEQGFIIASGKKTYWRTSSGCRESNKTR